MQSNWERNTSQVKNFLTSNFYSVLFYNREIWHLPTLSPEIKQMLLSACLHALKLSQKLVNPMQSFENINKECNRATPEKMSMYKHALLLYKLYTNLPEMDWIALNFQQVNSVRGTNFSEIKTNKYRIGNNIITNRLTCINNCILLTDLNDSWSTFKIKCKISLIQ